MFAIRSRSHSRRSSLGWRRRPIVELLEERRLLATLIVTDTSDLASDNHSLRYAILNAKNGDTIAFNILTTDPGYNATTHSWTIAPSSGLPAITRAVTIDGTSQPGYSGTPVVEQF